VLPYGEIESAFRLLPGLAVGFCVLSEGSIFLLFFLFFFFSSSSSSSFVDSGLMAEASDLADQVSSH
jgi:hypothetical protein